MLLILGLAAGYFLMVKGEVASRTRFEHDEYGWVAASRATLDLMLSKERADPEAWDRGILHYPYGGMNPNFAEIVMGLALRCWGYDLDPPLFFAFEQPGQRTWYQLNPQQRAELGQAHHPYITRMRWLVMCLGAAGAVVLYYVGRALSGPVLGLAAYAAFITTPLITSMSFIVYTDNLLMLMALLSVLATIGFARRWADPDSALGVWRTLAWLLLLAGLYGLTVGTKFNGAVPCLACALSAALLWVTGRFGGRRLWQTPVALAGVALVAFAVLVLLNPQWHADIPGRISWSLQSWNKLLARQQQVFFDTDAITTVDEQVAAVYRRAVLGSGPLAHFLPVGAAVLIVAGFALTCYRWVVGLVADTDIIGPSFLIVWSAVAVLLTTLWLPLDWPRYYMPFVPVFCLLQGVPVESAWRLLGARLQPSSQEPPG